jgi:hypothetical protein
MTHDLWRLGLLIRNHRQEALTRAYVQAIAALAGMSYSVPSNDYGIDQTINDIEARGRRRSESGYRLDVQAKSTTLARITTTGIRYSMEVQAYDDLRVPRAGCPRVLVVLILPLEEQDWCSQTIDNLIVRRCAYWLSLRGWKPTSNRKTIQVTIPHANVFSAAALQALMTRIKAGEAI